MSISRLKSLLAESYHNILSESVVYINANEVPRGIRDWVRQVSGTNIQRYRVDQSGGDITVSQPVFERSVYTYQYFKLTGNGDAIPMGNVVSRQGWESDSPQGYIEGMKKTGKINIPSGYVVVRYNSYPSMVDIYTASDAQMLLPKTTDTDSLSDAELIILSVVKSYIPAARMKYILPLVPKNQIDGVYESLISKGYLSRNRSITTEGRNLLLNPDIRIRVKGIVAKYNEENPHAYYNLQI